MILKVVIWVHNYKLSSNCLGKKSNGYTMQKSGHMVLKEVDGVHIDKSGSNGHERNQFGRQCKIMSYGAEMSQLGTK